MNSTLRPVHAVPKMVQARPFQRGDTIAYDARGNTTTIGGMTFTYDGSGLSRANVRRHAGRGSGQAEKGTGG